MESSGTNKQIIELGAELVRQLSDEERGDMLSRWIAHYIAEKMDLADRTSGTERASAQESCLEAILRLWEHRRSIPNGILPLDDFEPVLRALQSLDPQHPEPRYYRLFRRDDLGVEPPAVITIMDLIISLDVATRTIVDFLLTDATAHAATPVARALVEHASPSRSGDDLTTIRELLRRRDLHDEEVTDASIIQTRKRECIETLEKFQTLCQGVLSQLKAHDE